MDEDMDHDFMIFRIDPVKKTVEIEEEESAAALPATRTKDSTLNDR